MDGHRYIEKLKTDGYVVIPDVLTPEQCEEYTGSYKRLYSILKDNTSHLKKRRSLLQSYRVGHFNTTWQIRLQVKPVFEMLWGTKKLLTSVDGIAISDPPEAGDSDFRTPDDCWLHIDQGARRVGLHAYQGAVYTEESSDQDYCLRVMERSHDFHSEFFAAFPREAERDTDFHRLNSRQRAWFESQGCRLIMCPVPKGGIALWDSRTVYDNIGPLSGRQKTDRWGCNCFVSMTPAHWASKEDIAFKQKVYTELLMTTHWSSQGQACFRTEGRSDDISPIRQLPQIAKTKDAKLLMGVLPYNFNDNEPNGPPKPIWQ